MVAAAHRMDTVGSDKCTSKLLPNFTFFQAPSITQRVEYLRAPKCANQQIGRIENEYLENIHSKLEFLQEIKQIHRLENAVWAPMQPRARGQVAGDSRSCSPSPLTDKLLSQNLECHALVSDDRCFEQTPKSVAAPQPWNKRLPSWSAGAADHDAGDCRPCAWYWKPGGCNKGEDCEFCHMCEVGMAKHRKKEKIALLRDLKLKKPSKVITTAVAPLPPGLLRKSSDEYQSQHSCSTDWTGTPLSPASCASFDINSSLLQGLPEP